MVIKKGIKGAAKLTGKAIKGTAKLSALPVTGPAKIVKKGIDAAKSKEAPDLANEWFNQQVVGESNYWTELDAITKGKRDSSGSYWRGEMHLSHDKKNKHDRHAIKVQYKGPIGWLTVGYLPVSTQNKNLIQYLGGQRTSVPAKISGGRETPDGERSYYGVYLDMTSDTLNGFDWEPSGPEH